LSGGEKPDPLQHKDLRDRRTCSFPNKRAKILEKQGM
jgi:hypothetical protein